MRPASRHRTTQRALSLLELLVVILIIAVLAALLFPALGVARGKMHQTQCLQQLRQWGSVILHYSQDHEGTIAWAKWAPVSNDPATASPYLAYFKTPDMLIKNRCCPAEMWKADGKSNAPPTYLFTRPILAGKTVVEPFKILQINQAPQLLLMIDSIANSGDWLRSPEDFDTKVFPAMKRHADAANALFADFHIERVPWARLDGKAVGASALRQLWLTVDPAP